LSATIDTTDGASIHARRVDTRDAWMLESRHQFSFKPKSPRGRAARKWGPQNFQRDATPRRILHRFVHRTHAANTDEPRHREAADACPDESFLSFDFRHAHRRRCWLRDVKPQQIDHLATRGVVETARIDKRNTRTLGERDCFIEDSLDGLLRRRSLVGPTIHYAASAMARRSHARA
jgi:hypothetical protein